MIKLKQLLYEMTLDEKDMIVISNRNGVSISHKFPNSSWASTVSIDNHVPVMGFWWVSRVLIGDKNLRRKGIGSLLLQKAIQEVLKRDPTAIIIVEPAGTYGTEEEIQIKFYVKNGFIPMKSHKGVLVYNNPNMESLEYIKKLLKEDKNQYVWKAPKDTPPEVIRVLHLIIPKIIKLGYDPKDYLSIYKENHPDVGLCWVLEQKGDPKGGVVYSVREKKWFPFEGSGFKPKL